MIAAGFVQGTGNPRVLINFAYKFRLYPDTKQQVQLCNQFGAARFAYNYFLRQRIDHYTQTGKGLAYHDTALRLTKLKKESEYAWLKKAHSQVLQQSLIDLDTAYNNFFNKQTNFPAFKKKHGKQSCRFPQGFKLNGKAIYLPKIGWVRAIFHRLVEGEIKSVTVSKTKSGKYFASIQVERDIDEPTYQGGYIGLDLGLKDFAVTSEGNRFPSPKYFRKSEKKLAILQRRLSRKRKGSKGRGEARIKVARIHEKIANQRKDFLHKLSRQLVEENQLIAIEDLNVEGMVKNHSLAKSINDSGWSEFVRQLKYKGKWYGCQVEQVDRFFPSSKRCYHCGFVNQDLTLSEREWVCPECACVLDRDVNAARNILTFATAGTAENYAAGQTVRPALQAGLVEGGSPMVFCLGQFTVYLPPEEVK